MRTILQGRSALVTVVAAAVLVVVAGGTGAVAGGLVTSAKIKNNTIKSIDVRNNALTGVDVANESLTGADVKNYSLSNQDIGVLYASVKADGTVQSSSGGVVAQNVSTGAYGVRFAGRDLRNCAFTAQVADLDDSSDYGMTGVADLSGHIDGVYVQTLNSAGTLTNKEFHLVVVC